MPGLEGGGLHRRMLKIAPISSEKKKTNTDKWTGLLGSPV